MNRLLRSRLTASAVVTLSFIAVAPQYGGAAAAPAASPSAAPARTPAGDAQDPCGATKSKWQHMQCQQFNNSAPGDEYFGRLKISYLGIDNTFRDSAISAGAYTTDTRIIAKLMFADEALQRWASKYPGDPQLPRAYFLGVEVLRKVYTQDMQQMAWRYMQTLVTKYPSSYFAKSLKSNLDKGFTEHWFANALPCPTPLPTVSPAAKGSKQKPTPTPSPAPTPEPTPTPSPAPGQPSVQIITPPCVKPLPTPSPENSESPSPRSTR